jgi:hypothetical protein
MIWIKARDFDPEYFPPKAGGLPWGQADRFT